MDYKFIETLVIPARNEDTQAKEKLIEEFKPFIISFSKRIFIDGYDCYDIQNECYLTLFKCLQKYDPDRHRFVGFATNCIKNSIFAIIKRTKKRSSCEGFDTLTFSGEIESIDESKIDDELFLKVYKENVLEVVDYLEPIEKELLIFIFLKHNSTLEYAQYKKVCYTTAFNRRARLCRKLNGSINKLS